MMSEFSGKLGEASADLARLFTDRPSPHPETSGLTGVSKLRRAFGIGSNFPVHSTLENPFSTRQLAQAYSA